MPEVFDLGEPVLAYEQWQQEWESLGLMCGKGWYASPGGFMSEGTDRGPRAYYIVRGTFAPGDLALGPGHLILYAAGEPMRLGMGGQDGGEHFGVYGAGLDAVTVQRFIDSVNGTA